MYKKADLILALFDTSSDLTKEDEEIINLLQGKEGIVLLTKNDLSCVLDSEDLQNVCRVILNICRYLHLTMMA